MIDTGDRKLTRPTGSHHGMASFIDLIGPHVNGHFVPPRQGGKEAFEKAVLILRIVKDHFHMGQKLATDPKQVEHGKSVKLIGVSFGHPSHVLPKLRPRFPLFVPVNGIALTQIDIVHLQDHVRVLLVGSSVTVLGILVTHYRSEFGNVGKVHILFHHPNMVKGIAIGDTPSHCLLNATTGVASQFSLAVRQDPVIHTIGNGRDFLGTIRLVRVAPNHQEILLKGLGHLIHLVYLIIIELGQNVQDHGTRKTGRWVVVQKATGSSEFGIDKGLGPIFFVFVFLVALLVIAIHLLHLLLLLLAGR
mmetsp:Transcript_21551/g.44967  ORF Transcript_21551/g.44967 Transcript_21551/m.44967 type:complete len:304 (-) Transcript_21551:773-1684(-)